MNESRIEGRRFGDVSTKPFFFATSLDSATLPASDDACFVTLVQTILCCSDLLSDAKKNSTVILTIKPNNTTAKPSSRPFPRQRIAPPPPPNHTRTTAAPFQLLLPEPLIVPHVFCNSKTLGHGSAPFQDNSRAEVLITVISEPEDGPFRADYRTIWRLYLPMLKGNLLFIIANSQIPTIQENIKKEAEEYGDLLQLNTPSVPEYRYLKVNSVAGERHWCI